MMRKTLSSFLFDKSTVRRHRYPTRKNTLYSVAYMFAAAPAALILFVILKAKALMGIQLKIWTIQTNGEFGHLVELLEIVRGITENSQHQKNVLVLDFPKHKGLHELYHSECGWVLRWPKGLAGLISQAFCLQPVKLVQRVRLAPTIKEGRTYATVPLSVSGRLRAHREKLFVDLSIQAERFVVMSVMTRQYEDEMNPQYSWKTRSLETIGTELSAGIDYLRGLGLDVLMLGSPDTGLSRIPRVFPRLNEFGHLGGLHEVALTSACVYFWTDGVGAWWNAAPFKRPVLITNAPTISWPSSLFPKGVPWLAVPLRFQTLGGRNITVSEMLEDQGLFKLASRGEVIRIRNSETEIIESHNEMNYRLEGRWSPNSQILEYQARLTEIYSRYPHLEPLPVSSSWLIRNSDLLY